MIDLKGFKKVEEDKDSATLQHPKGHKITIVVSKLTPVEKEALKRLDMCKPERESGTFAKGGKVRKMYDEGTKEQPVSANDKAPVTVNVGTPSPQTVTPSAPQIPASNPNQGQLNPNVINGSTTEDVANPLPAVEQQQAAVKGQQAIDTQKAVAQANFENQYQKARQANAAQDKQDVQDMAQKVSDFDNFVQKNPIRQDAYLEDMKTGARITNALGMLLGGLGGSGQQAMDFLNKQIDRNIAAQQQNIENRKTVVGAYHTLYGDRVIASNLAKASMNDMLVHQANQMAAQLGTQQAAVSAQNLAAQKAIENTQLMIDSAGRQGQLRVGVTPRIGANGKVINTAKPSGATESWGGPGDSQNESPESQAMPMPSKLEEQGPQHTSILNPDAEARYKRLAYTPVAKDQYGEITKQYNQAIQSQKAIDAVEKIFPRMRGNATYSDYLASKVNPHVIGGLGGLTGAGIAATGAGVLAPATGGASIAGALPAIGFGTAVGTGAGEALGHGLKQGLHAVAGQAGIQYDADKESLIKILGSSLSNTNLSGEQIGSAIEALIPKITDDSKTYNRKIEDIKEFIKNKTDTSLLKNWKLSKE